MIARSSVRTGLILILTLTATATAWADYEVTIRYTEDDVGLCINGITLSRDPLPIDRNDHLQWFGGSLDAPPQVTWKVLDPREDYKWLIQKAPSNKLTTDERQHFESCEFDEACTQSARQNRPPLIDGGLFRWTYTVTAIPDDALGCSPFELDPQVVFNGGSGATILPGAAAIAAVFLIAILIYLYRRRRT